MLTQSPQNIVTQLIAQYEQSAPRLATNTVQSYQYDWNLFEAWAKLLGRCALPATDETVALFLVDRLERGNKVASTRRRLSVRGVRFGLHEQRAIVNRHREENLPLNLDDLTITPHKGATLLIRREKNDQTGRGREIGLPYGAYETTCPVRCLEAWLRVRSDAPGPLFLRMDRRGAGQRLRAGYVAMILKDGVKRLGLRPEDYGAHSLRAGLVTAAAENGVSELVIAAQTGHRSLDMVRTYYRQANLLKVNAAGSIGL